MKELDTGTGYKPLDFGEAGLTGSVDSNGRLIALNGYHPEHGYVTMTTATPFPEQGRHQPEFVRAYRTLLARLDGFGPVFEQQVVQRQAFLLEDAIPHIKLMLSDHTTAEMTIIAHEGGAIQVWKFEGEATWSGQLSLQRCAYTQLVEGDPLLLPPPDVKASLEDGLLILQNSNLDWTVAIAGLPTDAALTHHSTQPVTIQLIGKANTLTYGFGRTPEEAADHARRLAEQDAEALIQTTRQEWQSRWQGTIDDKIARRGLVYGIGLCLPRDEGICILSDHMLWPLSSNREAYYVARAFLNWGDTTAIDMVRRHLIWTFEMTERHQGFWGQSYLATGRIKDRAFQLDQQLYPLLEMAEYTQETADNALFKRLEKHAHAVIEALMARRAPNAWLFPDNRIEDKPYHLASHILFWYTCRQLQPLLPDMAEMAERIRQAIDIYFIVMHDEQSVYAHATDGVGNYSFSYDATDLPLSLAPAWGMIDVDNTVWRATIDLDLSEQTSLPSVLNDLQEMIIAQSIGDKEREQRAHKALQRAAQWDGALPEAYNASSHEVHSRHWFLWPNCAYVQEKL